MNRANEHHVDAFESTVRVSYDWIRDFGEALGQTHAQLCYRALRAGLHAVRDRLPAAESAALAAQLPMLIRGLWFEGWSPSRVPMRTHSADEVLAGVSQDLEGGISAPPGRVLQATFAVLEKHVDRGEIEKVRRILPEPIRVLWPAANERAASRAP